ncbi:MAG: putative porin [Bacteroidota bacterium]
MNKHKHTLRGSFLLCCLCFALASISQVKYTSDSSFINVLSNADKNNLKDFSYSKIDTSINNFQNYFPRNTNGHLGLPSAPLYIQYQLKALGFNMLTAPYQNDVICANDIKYYQTKGPYASLTGIAGSKQEQVFKMLFSHSFKNKLNIALGFNRYSGIGFYKNQESFTNNFYTTSNYTSKNGRAGYYAYVLFNKVKHQENGGISNDSSFLMDVRVNKMLLPVYLNSPSRENAAKREWRNTSIDVNPWFRLNKTEDSSTVLSHFLDYQFNFSGSYTKYKDPYSSYHQDFYQVYYLDTISTLDSSHWLTISNGLNYTLKLNPVNAKLRIGYKNEINQVYQYIDSSFINNSVNAGFYFSENNYSGFAKVNYILNGPNATDYSMDINNRYLKTIGKIPFALNFNVNLEKRHPDFIHNNWVSNHYIWNNTFSPIDKFQSTMSLSTADDRFDIGIVSQNIKNMIYFNELSVPEQTPVPIQNFGAFIHKDILLFKHLGINARYNYQSSSYEAIVSIPTHVVNGALYYQGNLFKKALQLQIGFNAQYYSKFYGYAYNPAINQYHVQTSKPVGDYPFIDFFLNARIKPVRIFVKIDHVTQGFLGNKYSLTPGYLQNDRAFKVGINWIFFD